jgi:hypothetical protein
MRENFVVVISPSLKVRATRMVFKSQLRSEGKNEIELIFFHSLAFVRS